MSAPDAAPPEDEDAQALRRMTTTGPGKTLFEFLERNLRFSSRFDGGNMASVEQTASGAFRIHVAEDAAAFGISTGYSTWFYFEVARGGMQDAKEKVPKQTLQLVLANLNPQRGLFKNGYTIMYSAMEVDGEETMTSCPFQDEKRWARLPTPLEFEKYTVSVGQTNDGAGSPRDQQGDDDGGEGEQETSGPDVGLVSGTSKTRTAKKDADKQETKIRVTFSYQFRFARERVRFAFCYPYTYTRVQEELSGLDRQFATGPSPEKPSANIYYHRELLTRSLEGLRVDLITISSQDHIISKPGQAGHRLPSRLATGKSSASHFDPKQKKMVVISARVHSAETPANFMLDGMLQLLLHPTDPSAAALRQRFVFKIIPMLNPDGVCQGFYRTDTRGVNLNRVYEDPHPEFAPTVFALKEFLLKAVSNYGGADSPTAQGNMVYLDLHAHANRRGCFVFGNNHLPDTILNTNNEVLDAAIARQVQTQLYARLISLHTPFFDYMACAFDKENMSKHDLRDNNNATTSRQGSSRVALYRATGLTYVYTIECNYNEGRRNLRASSLVSSPSSPNVAVLPTTGPLKRCSSLKGPTKGPDSGQMPRQTAPTSGTRLYLKYSPAEWKDVGIGALIALLDLFELPGAGPRLEKSPFRSREGICKNLLSEIKAAVPGEDGVSVKTTRLNKQKPRQSVKQQPRPKI